MPTAREFQIRGANAQKNTVRDKVQDAIGRLREANKDVPAERREEITQEDVEQEAPVSRKTLKKPYHRKLRQDILLFLDEINVGVPLAAAKAARPAPRTPIFKQNTALMQQVEALRYRLRTELAEKQRQIDAMAARVAALTDEIATLRRRRPADRAGRPKEPSRRSRVA